MLEFRMSKLEADLLQAAGDGGIYRVTKRSDGKWMVEYDAHRKHSGRFKRPFPQKLTFSTQIEAMALCNLFERGHRR
jgi:hypothetical protein